MLRAVLSKARNVRVILGKVEKINSAEKSVTTPEKTDEYDSLVLATGARTSYFGKDEGAQHTFGLKTLEDSRAIRH